jgi:hypothetical protein
VLYCFEEEIWEEFELRFRQVHSGFYDKLMEKFPDLTPRARKFIKTPYPVIYCVPDNL